MNRVIVLLVLLIAITALILWVAGGSTGAAVGTDQGGASLLYNVVALVVVLSALVLGWRGTGSEALRYSLIWIGILFVLVLGYSYRNDLSPVWDRVAGEVNPALPQERSQGEVVLRRADDGHFYADVDVNGSTIRMLADTGASTIALSADDAERAGIDVDQLDFIFTISTANGQGTAAQIDLDEVRVGSIVRRDVRAMVTRGLSSSLLGMSFFNTLSKVAIESDELVLED
jgi:aspartyl protease family protein